MCKFHLIRHGARICCKDSTYSVRQNWKSRFFSGYEYVRNVLKFWVRQTSFCGGFISRHLNFFFQWRGSWLRKGGIIHSFLPFLNLISTSGVAIQTIDQLFTQDSSCYVKRLNCDPFCPSAARIISVAQSELFMSLEIMVVKQKALTAEFLMAGRKILKSVPSLW